MENFSLSSRSAPTRGSAQRTTPSIRQGRRLAQIQAFHPRRRALYRGALARRRPAA